MMRKRDELSNPNSCLNRAKDDEWLFVLLGRDVAACAAVRCWINTRIARGKNQADDPQISEAEQWVKTVEDEQRARSLSGNTDSRPRAGIASILLIPPA